MKPTQLEMSDEEKMTNEELLASFSRNKMKRNNFASAVRRCKRELIRRGYDYGSQSFIVAEKK